MTEPLADVQLAEIGWSAREGVSDAGNQFHYYRLTEDNRILWGGYDAIYHFGNKVDAILEQRDASHEMLAEHFFETFPQLEDLRFSHRWAGPIGTTSRFTATWGTVHGGRLAWVAGYTGLGVGASRFGARVALDLVDGLETERTSLSMVRRASFPFPPEPLRWAGVEMTRRAIARADRRQGRRGPWLALLDRFGIGFDS
jgi:glycine/D-amino acid oxidase-like deaminating enzyme